MANIDLIGKIAPKNDAFVGIVDAKHVIGASDNKIPDEALYVVDDLVTGGATKPLSAEQGKNLKLNLRNSFGSSIQHMNFTGEKVETSPGVFSDTRRSTVHKTSTGTILEASARAAIIHDVNNDAVIMMRRSVDDRISFTEYAPVMAPSNAHTTGAYVQAPTMVSTFINDVERIWCFAQEKWDNTFEANVNGCEFLVCCYSDDDGLTWSNKISLRTLAASKGLFAYTGNPSGFVYSSGWELVTTNDTGYENYIYLPIVERYSRTAGQGRWVGRIFRFKYANAFATEYNDITNYTNIDISNPILDSATLALSRGSWTESSEISTLILPRNTYCEYNKFIVIGRGTGTGKKHVWSTEYDPFNSDSWIDAEITGFSDVGLGCSDFDSNQFFDYGSNSLFHSGLVGKTIYLDTSNGGGGYAKITSVIDANTITLNKTGVQMGYADGVMINIYNQKTSPWKLHNTSSLVAFNDTYEDFGTPLTTAVITTGDGIYNLLLYVNCPIDIRSISLNEKNKQYWEGRNRNRVTIFAKLVRYDQNAGDSFTSTSDPLIPVYRGELEYGSCRHNGLIRLYYDRTRMEITVTTAGYPKAEVKEQFDTVSDRYGRTSYEIKIPISTLYYRYLAIKGINTLLT